MNIKKLLLVFVTALIAQFSFALAAPTSVALASPQVQQSNRVVDFHSMLDAGTYGIYSDATLLNGPPATGIKTAIVVYSYKDNYDKVVNQTVFDSDGSGWQEYYDYGTKKWSAWSQFGGGGGQKGDKGDKGDTGPQGLPGVKGDTGLTGQQGIQGVKGDVGAKGDTGVQGIQGIQGVAGKDGASWNAAADNSLTGKNSFTQVITTPDVLGISDPVDLVATYSESGIKTGYKKNVNPTKSLNLALKQIYDKAYKDMGALGAANLDTILLEGDYENLALDGPLLPKNYPVEHAGILRVEVIDKGNILQIYTTLHNMGAPFETTEYIRGRASGKWSPWKQIAVNPMTTANDMVVGGASGIPTRLAAGANDSVLTSVNGVPTWKTPTNTSNVTLSFPAYLLGGSNIAKKDDIEIRSSGGAFQGSENGVVATSTALTTVRKFSAFGVALDKTIKLSGRAELYNSDTIDQSNYYVNAQFIGVTAGGQYVNLGDSQQIQLSKTKYALNLLEFSAEQKLVTNIISVGVKLDIIYATTNTAIINDLIVMATVE